MFFYYNKVQPLRYYFRKDSREKANRKCEIKGKLVTEWKTRFGM